MLVFFLLLSAVAFLHSQNKADLTVQVSGTKGPALIMIPGLSCTGEVWKETVARLQDKFQCHVLTVPGFGTTTPLAKPDSAYLDQISGLVIQYIEAQQLDNPILIGHSLGGVLALKIASEHPELPGKVFIVDALPFLPAANNPSLKESEAKGMAGMMKQGVLAGASQAEETRRYVQGQTLASLITDSARIQQAMQWSLESDPATVAQAVYELYSTDFQEKIAAIQVPVHVLGSWIAYQPYGATEESTKAIFSSQYAKAPDCSIEMSDIGKHFIMWDDPSFFQDQLQAFLLTHE